MREINDLIAVVVFLSHYAVGTGGGSPSGSLLPPGNLHMLTTKKAAADAIKGETDEV
jgi:hypothetical protein